MESLLVLLLIANLGGPLSDLAKDRISRQNISARTWRIRQITLSDQLDYRFEQARQASQLDQKRFGSGCQ